MIENISVSELKRINNNNLIDIRSIEKKKDTTQFEKKS